MSQADLFAEHAAHTAFDQQNPIFLTEQAAHKLLTLLPLGSMLRVGVIVSGSGALEYRLGYAQRQQRDDVCFRDKGVPICMDLFSLAKIRGTTIDFITSSVEGSGFIFLVPGISPSCGCEESFPVIH